MYIAKSKLRVQTKRIGRKDYSPINKYHGYLYLDVDNNNSINMNLRINDKRNSLKITIPKWVVYEMLMYHLSFRPIRKPKNAELYLNHEINAFKPEMDFNLLNPDEIKKEYVLALSNVREKIIQSSGKERNRADKQLNNLISKQFKVDLLHDLWLTNHTKPRTVA